MCYAVQNVETYKFVAYVDPNTNEIIYTADKRQAHKFPTYTSAWTWKNMYAELRLDAGRVVSAK